MGPRLQQIDELNKQGLTPREQAAMLGIELKTVREYQTRLRHIDGDFRPPGRPRKDHMPEQERELWRETLSERAYEITSGWRAAEAAGTVEVTAALNYWRGRAEEFNATREALVLQHPSLAKDLPPALEVDEIRVRQVVLEREQEQDKGLAIAR